MADMTLPVSGTAPNQYATQAGLETAVETAIDNAISAALSSGGVGTAALADNAATNAKLANMANGTIKGRATSGTGDPEDLTASQARTLLGLGTAATTDATAYATAAQGGKADTAVQPATMNALSSAGDIVRLDFASGTADAAVFNVISGQSALTVAVGVHLHFTWPGANTVTTPTLTIGGTAYTLRAPTGGGLAVGDLTDRSYVGRIHSAGVIRLLTLARIADVPGLQAALDAQTTALNDGLAAQTAALAAYPTTASLTAQREYVPSTAPPVFVDADPNGFARFVLKADGTMESTQEIVQGGNDVSLPGYAYVLADVSGYAAQAQRTDGSFVEADPAPPRGVAGDTHLLLVDGQSPFVASATTAVSTGTVSGLKMFNAGALPSTSDFTNATTAFTSFVNHVEAGNETSSRGMAEGLLAGATASGRPIVSAGSEIVTVVTAVGGQSVAALGPGGAYWHHKTAAVDRWAAICAAAGKIPGQVFWGIWQGEADTSVPMGGAAWAAAWEAARVALEDYIASVLGRRIPVVQVHMQTCANFWYNRPLPLISEAANIAAQYPRIFGPLPTYDFAFGGADGNGAHMSTATDSRHAGWRCGYALGQCWAGIRPARIVPTSAVRVGARQVRVDYGGGYTAPLALSTAIVANPGNFGFELGSYDAAGSFTALTLTTVKVTGGEAVVLIADADLPAGKLVVRYGYIGGALDDGDADPNGSFSGRATGARGCLQAETGRTLTVGGSTVTEYLRPAIHSITVE